MKHILYIEDHEDTRELIAFVLTGLDYRVTTSASVEDGFKVARENDFDLYLLDSWLADGSGIDLCRRLREYDQITPIMFLSGAAYEADEQTAMSCGAQSYVIKPADLDFLGREVARLIARNGKHRTPPEPETATLLTATALPAQ